MNRQVRISDRSAQILEEIRDDHFKKFNRKLSLAHIADMVIASGTNAVRRSFDLAKKLNLTPSPKKSR